MYTFESTTFGCERVDFRRTRIRSEWDTHLGIEYAYVLHVWTHKNLATYIKLETIVPLQINASITTILSSQFGVRLKMASSNALASTAL